MFVNNIDEPISKRPILSKSLRQAQILFLEILNVFLWLKFSPSLTLNKLKRFETGSVASTPVKTMYGSRSSRKRYLLILILLVGIMGGVIAGAIFALMRDLPQIRSLETFRASAVTRIYSSDQKLLAELYAQKRDIVSLEIIPEHLKNAVVTTEDRSFFVHTGVDLKGILRAIVTDIKAGEFVEGASTITQQLVKTLFLTSRKTLERKIREAILAFQLERRYTKNEILELYLNQIYFGSGAYGVQAAAHTFFGKPVGDLNLAECALIAAMPKAPSRYSPLVNPDLAVKRRNIVLKQMKKVGLISESVFRMASGTPFVRAEAGKKAQSAPYFIEHVKPFLEEIVGASNLYKGGLIVMTTLDLSLQAAADKAVAGGLAALESRMNARQLGAVEPQGALICLDVQTGGILAMVGGANFNKSPFNRATDAHRQPGSAFKPIVFALAVENGFAQSRQILDAPVAYASTAEGQDWRPENFSRTYLGEITLRKALALSKNIPAVRLIEMLGPSTVVRFGQRLGIRSKLFPYLSLVLGTSETTLMELTSAYAVFPNGGKRTEPYGVEKVVDSQGRVIWQAKPRKTAVMSQEGAAVMVDMLQAVVKEGTGRKAKRLHRPIAGKTGTTNDYKDALFIGFSPTLATGVWVGQDRYVTLGKKETGAKAALPIWIEFMARAFESRPYAYFDIPDGVVRVRMDPDTGRRLPEGDPEAVTALFREGAEPVNSAKRSWQGGDVGSIPAHETPGSPADG